MVTPSVSLRRTPSRFQRLKAISSVMACCRARSTLRFALLAYYGHTKMRLTPFARGDPRPGYPRRIVAHMQRVAAFEFCDPIVLFVLQESDNLSVKHFLAAWVCRVGV